MISSFFSLGRKRRPFETQGPLPPLYFLRTRHITGANTLFAVYLFPPAVFPSASLSPLLLIVEMEVLPPRLPPPSNPTTHTTLPSYNPTLTSTACPPFSPRRPCPLKRGSPPHTPSGWRVTCTRREREREGAGARGSERGCADDEDSKSSETRSTSSLPLLTPNVQKHVDSTLI